MICPICSQQLPQLTPLHHLAICIHDYCSSQNISPPCTCPFCRGRRSHPSTIASDQQSELQQQIHFTPQQQQQQVQHDSSSATSESRKRPHPSLDVEVLTGEKCIYCNASKNKRNRHIPLILIGCFRRIMICKKSHLTQDNNKTQTVVRQLEEEVANVKEKDSPIDICDEGEPTYEGISGSCDGYKKKRGQYEPCNQQCDDIIRIEQSEETAFFCCISHAFSYLIKEMKKGLTNQTDTSQSSQQQNSKS
jgi:hypothetical protein